MVGAWFSLVESACVSSFFPEPETPQIPIMIAAASTIAYSSFLGVALAPARIPPSTDSSIPVIYFDSPEAKNKAA